MTATSMYSRVQGSPLNNRTSYDRTDKNQICVEVALYKMSTLALVKCAATKHCDVNVTFAALIMVLFHLWTYTSDIH